MCECPLYPEKWTLGTQSVNVRFEGTQIQRSAKSVCLHELNNFRNFIRTPRTFKGVLVMTGLVGKDAHERHAAAARRTSRTHRNCPRLTDDRRHTHTNKQTEARDTIDID